MEEVGVRHSRDMDATNKKVNYTKGKPVQRHTRATIDLLDLEEKSCSVYIESFSRCFYLMLLTGNPDTGLSRLG